MNPNREEALFALAVDKSAAERATFLDRECSADAALRQRLDALLAAHDASAGILADEPAREVLAPTLDLPEPAPDEAVGMTLGRYKLREKLGEGGCGTVYVAEQTEPVRRKVALKVIKLGMDTREVIARFEAERQALAMMDHPNIAKVLDAGTTEAGRPYFVMELVRGIKITEYCDQNQLSTKERLDLFIKVCQAIQHAHQKGIIHRDIKPSNILVTLHDGVPVPKVIDFGIAKATEGRLIDATVYTQLHQFMGTPAYMSPEQAEMSGLDVDTRSDIYSLGVLLYQLLTSKTPFDGKELLSMGIDAMRKTIREKEPMRPSTRLSQTLVAADVRRLKTPSPDKPATEEEVRASSRRLLRIKETIHQLKGDLDWIVMKALEKDRTRRYETANGLAADIQRHLNNEPVVARPASQFYRFQKMVRRNKAAAVGVASVALALVLGLGLATAAFVRERRALGREQEARLQERTQSLRADNVANFINTLVWDAVPSMIQQGNLRGARELVDKADQLASSSLSNAPAAEINVRYRLRRILSERFNDYPAAVQQMKAIDLLLPKVSDDQLIRPKDLLRINHLSDNLWAAAGDVAAQKKAMKEMDVLYGEFMGRTPPDEGMAMICRSLQGWWLSSAGEWDKAEAAFSESYKLLAHDPTSGFWRHRLPALYAHALSARGKRSQAVKIARDSLATPPSPYAGEFGGEAWGGYVWLLGELSGALCGQDDFAGATAMLKAQSNLVAEGGGSKEDLIKMEALRGAVLARSGNVREALPILEAVATNRLSTALDWEAVAFLVAATGDRESCQRVSRIGLQRFASTAEELVAYQVADGMLVQPTDETTLAMTRAMVERLAVAQNWSRDFINRLKALLAHREHRYAEALRLLDNYRDTPITQPLSSRIHKLPGYQASIAFLRATLGAELGNKDEALRDFAQGRQLLKQALGDKPGHDRGADWWESYAAEARQREAEAVFKAKGISLPAPDAK